jgi:hypothetical protein
MSDVQTDHYFWLVIFSIRNPLYFVSDAPKLKNAVNTTRDDGGQRSSSNVPFLMNTGPIQVIEGSNTV